jgi:hypothetical protein
MSVRSPDLSNKPGTVPGRRDARTASPPPAGPATNSPAGGKLPLSATERTRHRRYRHLGRADRESLCAVLDAGLVAHLGVITGGWPMVVPTMYGFTADTLYADAPGQWDYARRPSRKELAAVRLLALPLEEASVKIRTGPPSDGDTPDAALGLWAGELPLATTWQQPFPDPALPPGIAVPAHIRSRAGTRAGQSTNSTPES